jgi:hypothetical protein
MNKSLNRKWALINAFLLGLFIYFLAMNGFNTVITSFVGVATFLSITLMLYYKSREI